MRPTYGVVTIAPRNGAPKEYEVQIISTGTFIEAFTSKAAADAYCKKANAKAAKRQSS